mmetsp:Transcript_36046/g.102972  ORF Transcript_36046/g.102972 Transcript_36046/m.102972 type:complete len:399 (-) Transcript_36046:194-1390(-)
MAQRAPGTRRELPVVLQVPSLELAVQAITMIKSRELEGVTIKVEQQLNNCLEVATAAGGHWASMCAAKAADSIDRYSIAGEYDLAWHSINEPSMNPLNGRAPDSNVQKTSIDDQSFCTEPEDNGLARQLEESSEGQDSTSEHELHANMERTMNDQAMRQNPAAAERERPANVESATFDQAFEENPCTSSGGPAATEYERSANMERCMFDQALKESPCTSSGGPTAATEYERSANMERITLDQALKENPVTPSGGPTAAEYERSVNMDRIMLDQAKVEQIVDIHVPHERNEIVHVAKNVQQECIIEQQVEQEVDTSNPQECGRDSCFLSPSRIQRLQCDDGSTVELARMPGIDDSTWMHLQAALAGNATAAKPLAKLCSEPSFRSAWIHAVSADSSSNP